MSYCFPSIRYKKDFGTCRKCFVTINAKDYQSKMTKNPSVQPELEFKMDLKPMTFEALQTRSICNFPVQKNESKKVSDRQWKKTRYLICWSFLFVGIFWNFGNLNASIEDWELSKYHRKGQKAQSLTFYRRNGHRINVTMHHKLLSWFSKPIC